MRISLIEDDRACRKLLADFLVSRGYEVFEYNDPTEYLAYGHDDVECLHENSCTDILLTDQNMPKMKGLDFIQQQINRGCKGNARNKALISANLNRSEVELATRLGCTIFTKPFSLKAILHWIEAIEANLSAKHESSCH
jgi:DNA-binding response OmpR family regulator